MVSVQQPARALLDPIDGLSAAIDARRWFWPILFLVAGASFAGAAAALRWDAGPVVTQQLQMSGELQNTTEQDLSQQIVTAQRVRLVTGVAQGVFVVPAMVLAFAGVLKLVAWLIGRPAPFTKLLSVVALSMLPIALFQFILGAACLRQPALSDDAVASLVPSNLGVLFPAAGEGLRALLSSLDFFRLWSAALVGLGFAAASGMRRARALLLAAALYGMYVGVFAVGMPGLRGGPA
jgi:hypothetical protein